MNTEQRQSIIVRPTIICGDYGPIFPIEFEILRLGNKLKQNADGLQNDRLRHIHQELNRKDYQTLDEFLNDEIPPEGEALRKPLENVIVALAQKAKQNTSTPQKIFLKALGSRGGYGVSNNRDYLSIGKALSQFSQTGETELIDQPNSLSTSCQIQLNNFAKNAVHDVDLDMGLPDISVDEFATLWEQYAGPSHIDEDKNIVSDTNDWIAFVMEPKKGIKVFIVRTASHLQTDMKLNDAGGFSIDFCCSPLKYPPELSQIDARGGDLVAAPEKMFRGFMNVNDEIRIYHDKNINSGKMVGRYGYYMMDVDFPLSALLQPRLAVEKLARLMRFKTTTPWGWDIGWELGEYTDAILKPDHLSYIPPDVWNEEIFPNLLAAIHLCPFIAAVNLLPNKILDQLTPEIQYKIANHGMDYSLSFGNMWESLRNITPEQPKQANHLLSLLPSYSDWDPNTSNGIEVFMDAVITAGLLKKEDSFGNALLDAYSFFAHPQDEEIQLLRLIKDLDRETENSSPQVESNKAEIIQRIAALINRKKPSWIDQDFIDLIVELNQ